MLNKTHIKKAIKYLSKIKTNSALFTIFSYLPKEKSVQILQINKKYSSLLDLNIGDYYLEKKYQQIIKNSKGNINVIYEKSINQYNKDIIKNMSFSELTSNIIKYLKYLYFKKQFKLFHLDINGKIYLNLLYFLFTIEIIRNLKTGLCLKISPNINYKYYEILKDAINNLEEIKSIKIHSFVPEDPINIDYINIFDWTKSKCLDLTSSSMQHFPIRKIDKIPNNASFKKLYVDEEKYCNLRRNTNLIYYHAGHIEHLKIFNFNDQYYKKSINKLDYAFFKDFNNLKCLKLVNCKKLSFYKFLLFFKNNLYTIKKLFLDNITESDSDISPYANSNYKGFINILNKLKNLEKLEINFGSLTNIDKTENIFKLLSMMININPNIKQLKIIIPSVKISKEEDQEKINENFINFNSGNKNNNLFIHEISKCSKLEEFINLIKTISSLNKITSLKLIIPMNDKMTEAFNNNFNLGKKLNNLEIIHSGNLSLSQLFISHPNLVNINFKLICNESGIKVEHYDEKIYGSYKMANFNYDFPKRNWKSIILNYYPINLSFINALVICKNSIKNLILNSVINVNEKSQLNTILMEIHKKLNN